MIREVILERRIHDWGEDLAVFAATYPGVNPLKLTIAVFRKMLDKAHRVSILLRGTYTEEMGHSDDIDRMNAMIIEKEKFRSIFPELPDE